MRNVLNDISDIICVGDLCCDLIVPYGEMKQTLKKKDISKSTVDKMQVRMKCGGSVSNTVRMLGQIGQHPIFVTPLKEDDLGAFLKDEMIKNDVNMDYAVRSDKSNMYCIGVLDETGERMMFCFIPPWADYPTFRKTSFDPKLYEKHAIVFSSGMAITNDNDNNEAVLYFMKRMKDNGSMIVFDLNVRAESYGYSSDRKRSFEDMIGMCDIVLGSGTDELSTVTGKDSIREAADCILHMGNDETMTVVARNGADSIEIREKGLSDTVNVKPVRPVSTVGAGDMFDSIFIACVRKGYDVRTCVQKASDLTGYLISQSGGTSDISERI